MCFAGFVCFDHECPKPDNPNDAIIRKNPLALKPIKSRLRSPAHTLELPKCAQLSQTNPHALEHPAWMILLAWPGSVEYVVRGVLFCLAGSFFGWYARHPITRVPRNEIAGARLVGWD